MDVLALLREIQTAKNWTQAQLGRAIGVDQSTVSRWYRKGQRPDLEQYERILVVARSLGLINGSVKSFTQSVVPVVGYVGAGAKILFAEGQGPFGEAPMPPEATKHTVAVIVRGDSMAGQLEDGWTVYYDTRPEPPTLALCGKLCVCGMPDGRVYIKKLLPGSAVGLFHLISVNAAPMLDEVVEWAARVAWIAPH